MLPHVCDHGSRKTNRSGNVHGKAALKAGISGRVEATELVHNTGYVGQHVDPWTEAFERMRNDLVWRRILVEIYSQELPVTFGGKRGVLGRDIDS